MPLISYEQAHRLTTSVFAQCGAPQEEAEMIADHLVDANLCGMDSHGMIRIPQYVEDVGRQEVQPGASVQRVQETGVSAVVDCGWNFGVVGGLQAARAVIDKAEKHGMAIVVTRRCNHAGRLGYYMERIAEAGLWGMGFCSSGRHGHFVVPWGGRDGRLATNPIAYGIPMPNGEHIIADFSTAQAPEGKIRLYRNRHQAVPEGWIIDAEGKPTTSPEDFYGPPQGGILPFGGALGYRGYSMGLLVELMATILSGADTTETRPGNGLAFLAFHPELLVDSKVLKEHLLSLAGYIKTSRPIQSGGEVLLPGEPERRTRAKRRKEGLQIESETWKAILETFSSLGLSLEDGLTGANS